ncbi:MAG: cobalamin B12-binding domain-containing protein [Pseudomonadota bacterium]
MPKPDHNLKVDRPAARTVEVQLLAAKAIAVLAARQVPGEARLAERLFMLSEAFAAADPEDGKAAIDEVLGDGLPIDDVIDHVLPATARLLGERWANDDLSFAVVSIASARLQETVRMLRARAGQRPSGDRGRALLIVPRTETHTLGVIVAADQLRRQGISVDFAIAPHSREVAARVRSGTFKLVGISAAGRRSLANVKELVGTIRRGAPRYTFVAVGGPLVDSGLDVKRITGADMATMNICAAARRVGLLPDKAEPAQVSGGR